MNKVFVYGSLKRGFHNHPVLVRSQATFIGSGVTKDSCYSMINLGGFPGVIFDGQSNIKGELFSLQDLKYIDSLEGHPHFYHRILVPVHNFEKKIDEEAWMYFITNKDYYIRDREIINSGIWTKR